MLGFEKTYKFPFKFTIPSYTEDFFSKTFLIKSRFKYYKRLLYMLIKHQKALEAFNILPEHKNILWINISAPSLGDSLMDLASRVLIKGRKIDLYTDVNNKDLYKYDNVFSSIFTKIKEVSGFNYDLIIIDSYSSRSINIKSQVAPKTKYVCMFGFYNGPEVNRVLFSSHQMNNLLGYIKNEIQINNAAKCSISVSTADQRIIKNINLPDQYIAISIGGEWKYRTYKKWDRIINKLLKMNPKLNVVLLGSRNALDFSDDILNKFKSNNIINCVNKFSFIQTAEIIKGAKILLCCDGGLMHAANAVGTPIVSMFARLTPEMQLTIKVKALALYDSHDVNNIPTKELITKYIELTKLVYSDPLFE